MLEYPCITWQSAAWLDEPGRGLGLLAGAALRGEGAGGGEAEVGGGGAQHRPLPGHLHESGC